MAKTALILDDSSSMRQMVGFTLKGAGFDVTEATNGKEGLDRIDSSGKKFDLVITDVNMPQMDGISFIKEARSRPGMRFTPMLILTTENGDDRKAQGKSAGATGWIVKPFQPDQLLKVIAKVLP